MPDAGEDRESIISALIESTADSRAAWRYPADHVMLAVLPDWLAAALTGGDREYLLSRHHILARSRTEVYGPEGDGNDDHE